VSASDDIKLTIVDYFKGTGIQTQEGDWKRGTKTRLDGMNLREFRNASLARTVYVLGDAPGRGDILEHDQWIYGVADTPDGWIMAVEPSDRWTRTAGQYDDHQSSILRLLFQLPDWLLDEAMENTFKFKADQLLKLHIIMKRQGLRHDPSYSEFLANATEVAAQPPQAPVNPPLPPAIKDLQPSQAVQAPAAPSAPVAASPAPAPFKLSLDSLQAPTFGATPAPAANAELADLPQAVKAPLMASRLTGRRGLDQANPSWNDLAEVQNELDGGADEIELERSNAIWALFERYDDGSGTPLINYFDKTDEELEEILGEILNVDEDGYISVVPDSQRYSSPYDLPVPPPVAKVARHFSHRTPGGMGALGGVPNVMGVLPGGGMINLGAMGMGMAPPAKAGNAPPPGRSSARLNMDSGEKWAEFCAEMWELYDANRTNLPMDVTWTDRFRPQVNQITGLGYKFIQREFTGITVQLGYLGREGEMLTMIDLPSKMLDGLLGEWGGDWNVDDVTHFINKRKGEDPETGFSYNSTQLWEEVEALLKAQGWHEAK
jgi:hypothetical protein